MIPYGRHNISDADVEAVIEVLRSDWLTQGPAVPKFEDLLAIYCGARHAVAVNSATSALHLACLALGVGPGDTVWTTPNTFVASANCALYCGAKIDFVDIDSTTWNMCPSEFEQKLRAAERDGLLPKVVIPVHLAGQSCEMEKIHRLAQSFGVYVIEDASHAIGGKYQGQPVGDCRFSDMTIFSFHPVKIVTTGEGGVVMTNSKELSDKIRRLRTHGITRDKKELSEKTVSPWHYEQIDLGFNYRMTDISAALGVSQLLQLDSFVLRRAMLAAKYSDQLASLPVTLPQVRPEVLSSWHIYPIRLRGKYATRLRDKVFNVLRDASITTSLHYSPVHLHPYYRRLGFSEGQFPVAEQYGRDAMTIPLYPSMSDDMQAEVVRALACALG